MNKQIVHYGTIVVSALTTIAAGVTSILGIVPGTYRGDAVEVAAILSAAAIGIKAFDAAIAVEQTEQSQLDS